MNLPRKHESHRKQEEKRAADHSVHESDEAPEGVDLVVHHHQHRRQQVAHPLHVAYEHRKRSDLRDRRYKSLKNRKMLKNLFF